MPKFSIIIPVYNVAAYLRECLDSVLAAANTLNVKCKMENGECKVENGKCNVGNLEEFLEKEVFAGAEAETLAPTEDGMKGFDRYAENFKEAL